MRPFRRLSLQIACLLALSLAAPSAEAMRDRRSVQGAATSVGPNIPEPSSIVLFLLGTGIVAYGVHRRRH